MIIVPTALCQPGMRIGKAVMSEHGRVMLGHRVELTQFMIKKLVQMGLDFLYIEDRETEDIPIEDSIHEDTCALLRMALSKIIQNSAQPQHWEERRTPQKYRGYYLRVFQKCLMI